MAAQPHPSGDSDARARVDAYLEHQSSLDVLRFITCGSVDDGKSTLIGRMLFEAQLIAEDQVAALGADSRRHGTQGDDFDFALLVDGLAAEREQGITIDVAYRFFATDHRKFIVADTPGHEQYTRNMVTGASTADVAVILVDASKGVLTQTRRHAYIASLLGIGHVALAVNKMDLIDYDHDRYQGVVDELEQLFSSFDFESVTPIPLSALRGDNVVERSPRMGWYSGPTLLGYLETVEVRRSARDEPFRMPVQWVNRPSSDYRGFAGTVTSGVVRPGDRIRVLPSGSLAQVASVDLFGEALPEAQAEQSITITLDREVDVSRGDLLTAADEPCEVSDQFNASIVWMGDEAGFVGRSYRMLIGTRELNATLSELKYVTDVNTFEERPASRLELNDIGRAVVSTDTAVPFEPYERCRDLGAFVLVDRYTNATVAAGMIHFSLRRASNVHRQAHTIDKSTRARLMGHAGRVIWFTGLSGAGKSTISDALERALHERGIHTYLLDGDNIRQGLNQDLGFTDADRVENIRRIAEVARLMADAGLVVLTAFISPFRSERDMARRLFEPGEFIEVYCDVPLDVAETRDPKGLYRKARRGELPNFTGIDSAYEAPEAPELVLRTDRQSIDECVAALLELL